jgi:hypothetical protein
MMAAKRGVPKGYKQSPEHVRNKALALTGDGNPQWTGDDATPNAGHIRALRMYPDIGPCGRCGREPAERHHKDGNTANNDPSNIDILCRRCHMEADGRLERFRAMARAGGLARQAQRRAALAAAETEKEVA